MGRGDCGFRHLTGQCHETFTSSFFMCRLPRAPDYPISVSSNFSYYFKQCCGSESGSTGSTCFWASWIRIRIQYSEVWIRLRIRILISPSKNSKKNLDSYCFATSFWLFSSENYVNIPSKSNLNPDPLVRGMDPRIQIRIRIHTKMSWIRNNDFKDICNPSWYCLPMLTIGVADT